jgi:hypothetical protein
MRKALPRGAWERTKTVVHETVRPNEQVVADCPLTLTSVSFQ